MRIQSSHSYNDRGFDAYFTCREAVLALIKLESSRLPKSIWEPAAGNGAIVKPLRDAGYNVVASDICDYGLDGCGITDFFMAIPPTDAGGMVTNPPFQSAQKFAAKAISEIPYVALLVRSNFLIEGSRRGRWLDDNPPTRQWFSAQRLPMMHRFGWAGPRSSSNTPHAWAIWESDAHPEMPRRFYWRELLATP